MAARLIWEVSPVTGITIRPIWRGTQVKSMKHLKSVYSDLFEWCGAKERSCAVRNAVAEAYFCGAFIAGSQQVVRQTILGFAPVGAAPIFHAG